MSRRNVQYCVKALETLEEITIHSGGGGRRSNIYQLAPDLAGREAAPEARNDCTGGAQALHGWGAPLARVPCKPLHPIPHITLMEKKRP